MLPPEQHIGVTSMPPAYGMMHEAPAEVPKPPALADRHLRLEQAACLVCPP